VIAKGWRGYKRGTTQIEGFDRDGTDSKAKAKVALPSFVDISVDSA